VVSTTTYADGSLRQLRAPARDSEDLSDVLADPDIGGFAVTSVIDGTAQQVRLAVVEFLTERSPDDLLVVYLSCHGLVDLRRRLYFAAADTLKSRLAATGVEAQWLLDQLEDCRARQQVLILDCCFSGAFAHGAKGDTDLRLGERFHGEGRGRVVLTASRASEYSFEGEPVAGSAMPGSVFTSALVAGIRSGAADADNDGYISVDDAYAYAFDHVRATDAEQTPQRWLYGAEGAILLARSPAGVTITPAALPMTLRGGLDSPHPEIRLGAVGALGEWLADDDPSRALAARQTLQQIVETDVPRVAAAANALLGSGPLAGGSTDRPGREDVQKAGRSTHVDQTHDTQTSAGAAKRSRPFWPLGQSTQSDPGQEAPSVRPVRPERQRRWIVYATILAALVGGGVTAALLIPGRDGSPGSGDAEGGPFTMESPWRLVIRDEIQGTDNGCTVTVTPIRTLTNPGGEWTSTGRSRFRCSNRAPSGGRPTTRAAW
jgi:hypothetical protein